MDSRRHFTPEASVFSLENTKTLQPQSDLGAKIWIYREKGNAETGQALSTSDAGITLPGAAGNHFPGITIRNADDLTFNELFIGPSSNFANSGVAQNEFEGESSLNWVVGRHSLSFGFNFAYTQLNVINRENDVANLNFRSFVEFLEGDFGGRSGGGTLLSGETNRYFRANQAGAYAQDNFKLRSNLTVNLGVRWDWDGPLWEKYGLLTNFYPQGLLLRSGQRHDLDSIGLVVAGNNKTFGTKGVSNSTMTGRQWGFAPRIGVVWAPGFFKNITVRAGFGMYYDRGEFFSELSPSAGLGISGPFGVTTEEPFSIPVNTSCVGHGCFGAPFGTGPFANSSAGSLGRAGADSQSVRIERLRRTGYADLHSDGLRELCVPLRRIRSTK